METLILTKRDVESLLTMEETIAAVETAFRLHGENKVQMPPKIYLNFEEGDLRAMPAQVGERAGIKWVNSHPKNPEKGLPTVMAVLILNDPSTGFPLSIMDATHLTNMRTGAAGAVAVKYLAPKNAESVGFIGCGIQARFQFLAVKEVMDISLVRAYDVRSETAKNFASFVKSFGVDAEVAEAERVCKCDVLITTTPSRKPVVKDEWIEALHINAIGADAPGKQELEEKTLLRAKIVVDDMAQALHSGEINVAISKGILKPENIYATLGEIVAGKKKGRENNELTIFDSTGLAIQDIATASVVYEKAVKEGYGIKLRMF